MNSFTIIRQVVQNNPVFVQELPFALALVNLEEGPRMVASLTEVDVDKVKIGLDVKITFPESGGGISIPKFKPAERL